MTRRTGKRSYLRASTRTYQGNCAVCGAQFLAGYAYALYCSASCRQSAYRERLRDRQPLQLVTDRQLALPTTTTPAAAPAVLTAGMAEVREWNGVPIHRREDGWVNATAMCQAEGKRWNNYIRMDRTQEYVTALVEALTAETACAAAVAPNRADLAQGSTRNRADLLNLVIRSVTTGPNEQRGTYIHPRLAVDFARWLRAAFAVWMDSWFLAGFDRRLTPHHHTTALPAAPGITVSAPTEREAHQLWQAAVEAEATRALRLTLGTRGRREPARPASAHWRWVAC